MRIWSLHPSYIDAKGLVALWRETLLAKHVLEGRTKGYKNHPQLIRFKEQHNPLHSINYYLSEVYLEAKSRGYNFDRNKIDWNFNSTTIYVTNKQVEYEFTHLLNKLQIRDVNRFEAIQNPDFIKLHPIFIEKEGEIESWEIIS